MSKFRFKNFEISHSQSSMKVGVDGVLIGAWTKIGESESVLEIGTGCGLIALMLAQRSPHSLIHAIDIHSPSIEEAKENFRNSVWNIRLKAELIDLKELDSNEKYSLIVSNPPFFNAGLKESVSSRINARHQITLTFEDILDKSSKLLFDEGRLSLIIPYSEYNHFIDLAYNYNFRISRKCLVFDHPSAQCKRVMIESVKTSSKIICEENYLTLKLEDKVTPTTQYLELCHDFYIKF